MTTSRNAATFASTVRGDEIRVLQQNAGLPDPYLDDLQNHVAPLAAAIDEFVQATGRPVLIGLNGCQGSGKSTLARFLQRMLQLGANLACVVVSIDDFYLTRSARGQLAQDVHPLLITRGVPGTHDLPLAHRTLDGLLDSSRREVIKIPVFNKATDDRDPPNTWPEVPAGVDVVLFDGWCIGCPPEESASIAVAVNELERDEDPDGVWRQFVNSALTNEYRELFGRLDRLIMLTAPSFECVYEWREQQEHQLARSLKEGGQTTLPEPLLFGRKLRRFVQHFERLTRHQLRALPPRADALIELADNHRMVAHQGGLFT